MFSAGSDLSVVTWHPPRQDVADAALLPRTAQAVAASPLPSPHDAETEERRRNHSDSTEEPSPAPLPPPSPSAIPAQAAAADDEARAGVTHESDSGVVVHAAEVVGMAVVPGGLVSADLAGRLLERGPERLIGECSLSFIEGPRRERQGLRFEGFSETRAVLVHHTKVSCTARNPSVRVISSRRHRTQHNRRYAPCSRFLSRRI